jgi:hypothetical protein
MRESHACPSLRILADPSVDASSTQMTSNESDCCARIESRHAERKRSPSKTGITMESAGGLIRRLAVASPLLNLAWLSLGIRPRDCQRSVVRGIRHTQGRARHPLRPS